jgi:hypothetical protein
MSVVLYQKAAPDEPAAQLQRLPAAVIILRLRRPADPKVVSLEADVRARLRAVRGLQLYPLPQAGKPSSWSYPRTYPNKRPQPPFAVALQGVYPERQRDRSATLVSVR